MFVLAVTAPDKTVTRHVLDAHAVTIGSAEACEVRIADASHAHAKVVVEDGVVWFEPIGPVLLREQRIERRLAMRFDDRFVIANHVVMYLDTAPRQFEASYGAIDRAEVALVDAILERDEASRLVYADYLDDRGDPRANLVRELQPGVRPTTEQLALLVDTNVRWRARVLQPAIEGCSRRDRCPGHWGEVTRTNRADLKTCGACAKLVQYSVDVAQAGEHVARGGTVVLDPLCLRWPGDLRIAVERAVGRRDR